ncbi:MAG TPA: 50S ribosomal protein L3 [Candidatus Paceibacterota bacterium]
MKYILGTKKEMTAVFDDAGKVFPATIIYAEPMTVIGERNEDKDGYSAVIVGYGTQKESRISKPEKGKTKNLGNFKKLLEFRPRKSVSMSDWGEVKVGEKINLSVFKEGDVVQVSGVSKGKGFQGVVKRHGFKGGPRTHGQKHSEREGGSIGGGGRAGGRVAKGMRMPGRMGGDRITVKNLEVLLVDPDHNLIVVSGAVPGKRGTLLEIRSRE